MFGILFFAGCAGQKKTDESFQKIEYKAYSRGFYQMISAENQQILVSKNRNEKPIAYPISETDWKSLLLTLQKMDLETLSQLQAPSQKRFYDGAAIASLKITKQGKSYESQSFDHGFPPTELKNCMDILLSLAKQKE